MREFCFGNRVSGGLTVEGVKDIPVLRLLKETAATVDELWVRYPQGGEYGWFALVKDKGMFYYWDVETKNWLGMQSENLEDIIDHGTLQVGDMPVWDGSKFTTVNLSLFVTENY